VLDFATVTLPASKQIRLNKKSPAKPGFSSNAAVWLHYAIN
jgi:hypothetical protein